MLYAWQHCKQKAVTKKDLQLRNLTKSSQMLVTVSDMYLICKFSQSNSRISRIGSMNWFTVWLDMEFFKKINLSIHTQYYLWKGQWLTSSLEIQILPLCKSVESEIFKTVWSQSSFKSLHEWAYQIIRPAVVFKKSYSNHSFWYQNDMKGLELPCKPSLQGASLSCYWLSKLSINNRQARQFFFETDWKRYHNVLPASYGRNHFMYITDYEDLGYLA